MRGFAGLLDYQAGAGRSEAVALRGQLEIGSTALVYVAGAPKG